MINLLTIYLGQFQKLLNPQTNLIITLTILSNRIIMVRSILFIVNLINQITQLTLEVPKSNTRVISNFFYIKTMNLE